MSDQKEPRAMKYFRYLLVIAIVISLSVLLGHTAKASGFYMGSEKGEAKVNADQILDGSVYLGGTSVVMEGTVRGDVYCAGETVVISGTVDGDVICGGSSVTVSGQVSGDIRVAGSTVVVSGVVDGNASVAGSSVTITKSGSVGGDITGGASQFTLDGKVGRDMLLGAETANFNGSVGRDVNAGLTSASFGKDASVKGNFSYYSESQSNIPDSAVAGEIKYDQATESNRSEGLSFSTFLIGVLMVTLLAVVGVLVAPRFVHTASTLSLRQALLSSLAGIAFVLLTPIVAVLCMLSGVGLLLGFVIMTMWILALLASSLFVSYYVGSLVLQKRAKNALLVALVGGLILGILCMMPIINILVIIITVFLGIGMQIMHLKYQFGKDPYTITS